MSQARLLLIEDEARIRENLEVLLANSGYLVTAVECGDAGLARASEQPFDLVVTDLVMEGYQGFDLLDRLRANIPGTPIIVVTGNTSTLGADEALRRGASDYIAKPFAIGTLRSAIERFLDLGGGPGRGASL